MDQRRVVPGPRQPGAVLDWRRQLLRRLEELGPMTHGRYLPVPDAAAERVDGERLLDAEFLRACIARARPADPNSAGPRDHDPRIGVSRMSRQYCAALTCVAITGLAGGVGIDLSPGRCTAIIRDDLPSGLTLRDDYRADEVLRCAERPAALPVNGPVVASMEELREFVWTNLYARNLGPMLATAVGMVNVPERLLWTNAAEWVGIVMDSARQNLPPQRADAVVAECRALLEAEFLPGFGDAPNPLRGLLEWLPFDGDGPRYGIQTRHLCCLVYLHTDRRGRLCQNCPLLPLADRAALVRERGGMGKVNPDGPAERRCVEVGLSRRRH